MITIEKLNNDDLHLIKTFPGSLLASLYISLVIAVPLSLLVGLAGTTKKGIGYWNTALLCCGVLMLLFILNSLKEIINYARDIKYQVKLTGTITVTGKANNKNSFKILTGATEISEFYLFNKTCFDKIETGDELVIHISKFQKTLLLLEKDGVDLLECS